MNTQLQQLLQANGVLAPEHWRLQAVLAIGFVERVRHLLEDARMVALLDAGVSWRDRAGPRGELEALAQQATAIAASHPGSPSIDGAAHAAVSASHAVANALHGRALQAADYAAYATVYAYAASAVTQPEAYETEYRWQYEHARRHTLAHGV